MRFTHSKIRRQNLGTGRPHPDLVVVAVGQEEDPTCDSTNSGS
uniref:Uncharacterized protein n=1 Tax=Manihot esculenta TaxID=3983 RepID=A0A2C9UHB0_MANES